MRGGQATAATMATGRGHVDVAEMMGCDHPSFVQIGLLICELQHFKHFPIWRPFILNQNFIILESQYWTANIGSTPNFYRSQSSSCGPDSGPPTKMLFGCPVKIWCRSNICCPILRFYDFASLAGKCLITPPFWEFQSLKIVRCHQHPNRCRTTLGEGASFKS